MGNPDAFVVSAGDMTLLPMVLEAAAGFLERSPEEEMAALVQEQRMRPVFA